MSVYDSKGEFINQVHGEDNRTGYNNNKLEHKGCFVCWCCCCWRRWVEGAATWFCLFGNQVLKLLCVWVFECLSSSVWVCKNKTCSQDPRGPEEVCWTFIASQSTIRAWVKGNGRTGSLILLSGLNCVLFRMNIRIKDWKAMNVLLVVTMPRWRWSSRLDEVSCP